MPASGLARFGDRLVCPYCKDSYAQKLREGVVPAVGFRYGGFWIRLAAWLIDTVILGVVQTILNVTLFHPPMAAPPMITPGSDPMAVLGPMMGMIGLSMLLGTAMQAVYFTLFWGAFGATPGMLALGLKVVRPSGAPISYVRALGRYFGTVLSGLILGIGYLMIAFDSEKRGLHDMICDTRVIRTRE
jgi:uncharacterized RDD family membrane protein YckC